MVQKPLKSVEKKISLTLMGLRSVLNSRMEKNPTPTQTEEQKTFRRCRFAGAMARGSGPRAPGGRTGTSRGGGRVCPGPLRGQGRLSQHTLPPCQAAPELSCVSGRSFTAAGTSRSASTAWTCPPSTAATKTLAWSPWATRCRPAP